MENTFLSELTKKDINKQVRKVIRGLGYPDPPLRLADVGTLLELDKQYYSSSNDSALAEHISKLKVGTQQIIKRPTLILDAIKKFDLRALYLPDRQRVLLDQDVPKIKQRWNEAHEYTHKIIPWHNELMLGDTQNTLSLFCHEQIEAEANYAAGRLLFLQEKFDKIALSSKPNFAQIQQISKQFGNTLTSTFWRIIDIQDTPTLGLISRHPMRLGEDANSDGQSIRYFLKSDMFARMFSRISPSEVLRRIQEYCGYSTRGPLGAAEVILEDDCGEEHCFVFETFYNTYEALTIGLYEGKHKIVITKNAA